MATHQISDRAFSALATGGGGTAAVEELRAAQTSKHRLLVRLVVDESHQGGHAHAALAARAYASLADLEEHAPEVVGRCLRHPPVGQWALDTCRAMLRGGGDPGRLAALAVAAAVRAGAACSLKVPVRDHELMLPSVGRLLVPDVASEVVEVTVEPTDGGAELGVGRRTHRIDLLRDSPGWHVLHDVSGPLGVRLTIDDLDPYRWPSDDADGRLTDLRRERWASCLREAWRILVTWHPTVAEEVAAAISVLTPITAGAEAQRSASARGMFGTIALSDPTDGLGLALILAHELEHAKLNALTEVVELVRPDDGRRYYAPWRKDPRPLFGLLHGAYAHAGVAAFWRRHTEDPDLASRAQTEFARWREAAHQVTGTLLDSGALTAEGTRFVGILRDTLGRWRSEPVTAAASAQARRESERHQEAWTRLNS
ncbi:HEXXH motif domain-containing protein [Nonomuraea sp. NPDC005650]|uniref:HEXXH motif domain-containing protein n=1 Tax=Nonomuraea sp. NPDC005650 TaxID=3157045 RepID=UPI0033A9C88A